VGVKPSADFHAKWLKLQAHDVDLCKEEWAVGDSDTGLEKNLFLGDLFFRFLGFKKFF